jgi:two-component system LytT family response regulator/two-component system response regulator LytT
MILRTLVVDDEQPAREEMCFLLGKMSGIEIVGQASNGVEAAKLIEDLEPDLVLLDVQMPGLTGFEVARRLLQRGSHAHVVFVTAFDQYAIEAFSVNAVDYLLKPVEAVRLEQAVDRARRRVSSDRTAAPGGLTEADLDRLAERVARRAAHTQQVAIRAGDKFVLVPAEDIVYVSLVEDAITVVTNSLAGTSNYKTLDELQSRLDPNVFWRVHRSHLVNINKIKEIVPWFSRNYVLRMKDAKGTEIPVSRTQTKRLRDHLKL